MQCGNMSTQYHLLALGVGDKFGIVLFVDLVDLAQVVQVVHFVRRQVVVLCFFAMTLSDDAENEM
jgi:hypothetical protein